MKTKPPVSGFYDLENLGMTVAERVCRPTILEINVAFAVQVPDEVALRLINNDLPHRTKTALPGSLHFGIEPQSVLEKRNAAFECRARPGTRELVSHDMKPREYQCPQFGT